MFCREQIKAPRFMRFCCNECRKKWVRVKYERKIRPTDSERFWKIVSRGGPEECWPWIGQLSKRGRYGKFTVDNGKRKIAAHVFAYIEAHGPIPKGMDIHHKCWNKICQNVRHMELLTHKEHAALGHKPKETTT